MGWIVAWLGLAIFIGVGCTGTVGHPIIYGFFVSTVVVGLARLFYGFFDGIFGAVFGRRR